LVVELVFMT